MPRRCIESIVQLTAETAAWEQQRNATGARIKWMFTTEKARVKMGRAYPQPQANSRSDSTSQNFCAAVLGPVYIHRVQRTTATTLIMAAKQVSVFS